MKQFLLFLTAIALSQSGNSQSDIPEDYFSSPLAIPLELSGTFGELRNNHFHAGVDIRTQQRQGLPVYAAADGYVNRIKVAHFGYGKALYIQHPNGYISVYAHLKQYTGAIEEYVKKNQYQQETFEIELFPKKDLLKVKKGDLIGFTGNTGGSGGPHLHFEIRDNASRPMNPLLFGMDIADTRKPLVNSILVYPHNEEAQVNQNQNPQQLRLIPQKDGTFHTEKITASGTLGFGISTVDQQNAANNRNGVYKIESKLNGKTSLDIRFNIFSFAETRFINRYIDYSLYKKSKSRVQKLFIEKNNPLSIFKKSINNGYVHIEDGFDAAYTIEVADIKGNTTKVTVPIEGKKLPVLDSIHKKTTPNFVFANQGETFTEGKFTVTIPPKSLYEDTFLYLAAENDKITIHNDRTPIHSNIKITADVSNYDESDLEKMYIGKLNYMGIPYYRTTRRNGNQLTATTRDFGEYALAIDTVPPTIRPLNFTDGQWISKHSYLQLKIDDAMSGIKSYRATINEKWILMEYEYKNDVLTYDFADNVNTETENNLKIIVTDNVGNSTTFEATFYRK